MSTHGYCVSCYQGYYFVHFIPSDGYPSALGYDLLCRIPDEPEAFQEWLQRKRQRYAKSLANLLSKAQEGQLQVDMTGSMDSYLTRCQPRASVSIPWVYETNLDDLIFRVNKQPFYRLDNLPPREELFQRVERDHYGHAVPPPELPIQYRCDIPHSRLGIVGEELRLYHQYNPTTSPTVEQIHDMLRQREGLSDREAVCVRMFEVAVGITLRHRGNLHALTKHIVTFTDELKDFAYMLVKLACCPLLYARPSPTRAERQAHERMRGSEVWWVRKHICVFLTSNLDNERGLQAAESRLLQALGNAGDGSTGLFGVAFSFSHVNIIRFDFNSETYTRTGVLSFLPTPFATTPRTEGIVALVRLCHHTFDLRDDEIFYARHLAFVHSIGAQNQHDAKTTVDPVVSARTPGISLWVWTAIASRLHNGRDLAGLALSSRQLLSASMPCLKYPQIRLTDFKFPKEVVTLTALGPESEEYFTECKDEHLSLYGAAFYTNSSICMTDDEDHSNVMSIAASGLEYRKFQAIAAERLRFLGIHVEECQFAIFKGTLKEIQGSYSIPSFKEESDDSDEEPEWNKDIEEYMEYSARGGLVLDEEWY